jgi:hypothetical protein
MAQLSNADKPVNRQSGIPKLHRVLDRAREADGYCERVRRGLRPQGAISVFVQCYGFIAAHAIVTLASPRYPHF